MVLKSNDSKKRENEISCCSKLLSENDLLKSKVKELELVVNKFSTGEKSFNMLLGNQLFANNRKGLGFDKVSISKQTTNHGVKARSVIPKCIKCGNIGHDENNCWNERNHKTVKQFRNPNSSKTNFLKCKKIWVQKGTIVNANGELYKQIWVPKILNKNRSGSTIFSRLHTLLEI